jgi:serine/threonine-protein kinase
MQVSTAQRRTDRYRPVHVLGHGGMATVELAHDRELDRPVAIKRLADNLAANGEFKQRFLREARLAARLAHPNIVAVYDVGDEDDLPFIVMEYVEGETLGDLLRRRGRLEPDEAVAIALQACAGLETAHEAGLVHRDIKPQNLLVTPGGTVKIADFGIARSLDGTQLTKAGTVLGTAAYLAPEQGAGERVTAAADVYALGAVLYELLTGRPPYIADSLAELAARQREGTIAPVRELAPAVPAATEDAVMHALARDPEYRPPSAAALAGELRPTPTAATEIERSAPVARPATHGPRRALLAALALGAAIVVVFVVALSFRGGSKHPSVTAPPSTGTPAQQADAFGTWLRDHAAGR